MVVGTARFARVVREELERADLEAAGFYLCTGCGYAHVIGSRCAELVAREHEERERQASAEVRGSEARAC